MFPRLQLGPLALPVPGLILILGLWLGITLAEKLAVHRKVNPNHLYNLVFSALVGGLLSARIIAVLQSPWAFQGNFLEIFSLNAGLLDVPGGISGGILIAVIYGSRKNLPFWETMDALTPALGVMLLALALSNLSSGHGFGMPTDLPWGIALAGDLRHPSQIYEGLAAGCILLWILRGAARQQPAPGNLFLDFTILAAATRLFLETFRGDSLLIFTNIRAPQVLAWLVLAAALSLYYRKNFVQPMST